MGNGPFDRKAAHLSLIGNNLMQPLCCICICEFNTINMEFSVEYQAQEGKIVIQCKGKRLSKLVFCFLIPFLCLNSITLAKKITTRITGKQDAVQVTVH